jgi:cellulose biosynthesis protein BcsQ
MMPQIIRRQLRDKLFNTMIRISADIKASIAVRTPLFDFKPRSRAVYNFRDLAEEFLQRIEKNKGW